MIALTLLTVALLALIYRWAIRSAVREAEDMIRDGESDAYLAELRRERLARRRA